MILKQQTRFRSRLALKEKAETHQNTMPQPKDEAAAVQCFAECARPPILRYLNRRSCIASCRITIEVLKRFGIAAHPVPVRFVVCAPVYKIAFISGFSVESQTELRRGAARYVDLAAGPKAGGGNGTWNGHVAVVTANYFLDPSFDQSLDALASNGLQLDPHPYIALAPLPQPINRDALHLEFSLETANSIFLTAQYNSISDYSFLETPAWELDHVEPVIEEIAATMEATFERCT